MIPQKPQPTDDELAALVRSGVGFGIVYGVISTAGHYLQLYALGCIEPSIQSEEMVRSFLMLPVWRTVLGVPTFLLLVYLTRWSFVGLGRWPVVAGGLAGGFAGFAPLPFPFALLVPPLAGYVLARGVEWQLARSRTRSAPRDR